jgi:hypothetical protein
MAIGLQEQKESTKFSAIFQNEEKPWKKKRPSTKWSKTIKHRRERRRAETDPECPPHYRKYRGYEY